MRSFAEATFTIMENNEEIFSESGDGPRLARGNYILNYHGDLQGRGVFQELKCYYTESYASIQGLERITGSLDCLHGSFVLRHEGTLENGYIKSKRSIVPRSGTGDFENLSGEIHFESGPVKEYPITLNYELN